MREHFLKELEILKMMFLQMGEKVQEVICKAVESLKEQNLEKARWAIQLDDEVDKLEREIENKCMSLIALQQPIAKDLRRIGAILKGITDMERIGDYGVNIAKITLSIGNEKLIKPLIDIPKMATIIETMLQNSIESFMKEDIHMAKKTAEIDEAVDHLYKDIYEELHNILSQNPMGANQATSLLLVARYLERIADHTVNICERTIFMVTGDRVEIN
ncbi:phosphate signaling complex protein PhoU [Thermotalea metallivorans]|uniref:Phosphate-specific transport system accessory protein PhoU n=1 Tax=Thermotalea metallivorans TaxID=520762 RepID=A0A140L1H7_9FIRM|nr:phosphate signaling complex protein PhoU [Thermotalea metallivorans]KXG74402.1 hypothetical protein AN619_23850 [Thermotalea metallivorans]